jgi:hypothetical protein
MTRACCCSDREAKDANNPGVPSRGRPLSGITTFEPSENFALVADLSSTVFALASVAELLPGAISVERDVDSLSRV